VVVALVATKMTALLVPKLTMTDWVHSQLYTQSWVGVRIGTMATG
jgi:hypothetical protein